jgi:hypothetical protein
MGHRKSRPKKRRKKKWAIEKVGPRKEGKKKE